MFLGDSYTAGSGVEDHETFVALMEAELGGVHCFNLGIGAFGVDQMWRSLIHHGLALQPDVVVLAFIRNDLDRSMTSYRHDKVWRWKPTFRLEGNELVEVTEEDRPGGLFGLVERHSRLFGLWRKSERSLIRKYAIGSLWKRNRALFQAIQQDCADVGVPLVVVHIPVNKRKPTPMFTREFANMEIDFLDLGPALPPDADRLYYPRDHHFNAEGHRFASRAISGFLRELGLCAGVLSVEDSR